VKREWKKKAIQIRNLKKHNKQHGEDKKRKVVPNIKRERGRHLKKQFKSLDHFKTKNIYL